MIQRKQTIFLLLAFVLTAIVMFSPVAADYVQSVAQIAVIALASLSSLCAIFLYNKRKVQARVCLLNIALLLGWYLLLALLPQQREGVVQLEWAAVLPAVSIILVFMARKAILADERLVRSLDRIR